MSLDYFQCTPRQVRRFVIDAVLAGLVPYVQSHPGMGKSALMRSIAKEAHWAMIDHRLSTSTPEDLTGLPRFEGDTAVFAPFTELFPIEGMQPPEDKVGWMLFLDEFSSASRSVQAASYKLILDRMVGQKKLNEQVVITAAGNLESSRAIVNPLSTAMQSRLVHLEMVIDFDEWLEDVALPQRYDSRIIGYLSRYPSKLMDFNPEHSNKTFCCPRTWEFVNRLIKDRSLSDDSALLLAGTITAGVAVDFVQFTKAYQNLISIREILRDPANCPLPQETAVKWATVTHMMEHVDADNFGALAEYANRFTTDFRILFFRSVMIQQEELRHHPAYAKAKTELAKYLYN